MILEINETGKRPIYLTNLLLDQHTVIYTISKLQ